MPEVDNLYLDMNGIIHNCTHGNDPGTKLTETQMIVKVFNYLEKLFQIVQPQKLLFMAIDGARCMHSWTGSSMSCEGFCAVSNYCCQFSGRGSEVLWCACVRQGWRRAQR